VQLIRGCLSVSSPQDSFPVLTGGCRRDRPLTNKLLINNHNVTLSLSVTHSSLSSPSLPLSLTPRDPDAVSLPLCPFIKLTFEPSPRRGGSQREGPIVVVTSSVYITGPATAHYLHRPVRNSQSLLSLSHFLSPCLMHLRLQSLLESLASCRLVQHH
jgi:hypothetical protein